MMWLPHGAAAYFLAVSLLCLMIGFASPQVIRKPPTSTPVLKDMSGRDVDLERPLHSIALLPPILSAYAVIDGGIEHVVAISPLVQHFETKGTFGRVFPKTKSLPLAGTYAAVPAAELVLRIQPQIVVAYAVQSEALRATGYPGLVELAYGSRASIPIIWRLLAKVAGQEGRTEELWADAAEKTHALQRRLPKLLHTPEVLPMAPLNVGSGWFFGGKSYNLNELLEFVGANNPAHNLVFSGPADPEKIIALNPDYILIPGQSDQAHVDSIYNDPQWQVLRAVRQRRVYVMPAATAINVPVDETLSLIWLAQLLYPDLPPMIRDAYRQTYAQAYHYDLNDDEIDYALAIIENKNSVGYDRFTKD